jgi:hypothetical protein
VCLSQAENIRGLRDERVSGGNDLISHRLPARVDTTHESHYAFDHGFPTADTMSQSYDDADLNRAIQAYKFFYPTVSGAAIVRGNEEIGIIPNKVFGILDCSPEQLVFTANSDTPYGPLMLDLGIGPMVVELAPGPLIVCSMDVNQRWVADMGLPGPDAGKGGKHLLLPPDYTGAVPSSGYYIHRASRQPPDRRRSLAPSEWRCPGREGTAQDHQGLPYQKTTGWREPQWIDVTGRTQDTTPLAWEENIQFWEVLAKTVDAEPLYSGYHDYYGELAALGIEKGKRFAPDARLKRILEEGRAGRQCTNARQAFGDRRPDRNVWKIDAGSGRASDTRTATSTRSRGSTSKRVRSGSIRPSARRRRCSDATRMPARCTGSACATARVSISKARSSTSSRSRCPFPASCSGQ